MFDSKLNWNVHYNGDLQIISRVDQLPHLEVPYPLTNRGQQLRHASGRCPAHIHSVTCISKAKRSLFAPAFKKNTSMPKK